jgi:hypothetical protein
MNTKYIYLATHIYLVSHHCLMTRANSYLCTYLGAAWHPEASYGVAGPASPAAALLARLAAPCRLVGLEDLLLLLVLAAHLLYPAGLEHQLTCTKCVASAYP